MKISLINLPDISSTRDIFVDKKINRNVPKGLSIDIISCNTLLSIDQKKLNEYEKEHVIPVFYNGNYNVNLIQSLISYKDDLSIDTEDDFKRIQKFANSLIIKDKLFEYLGFEA